MFKIGLFIALIGAALYALQYYFGLFSSHWPLRQVPSFVLAGGAGLLIPNWVWVDIFVVAIVLVVLGEIAQYRARRQAPRRPLKIEAAAPPGDA